MQQKIKVERLKLFETLPAAEAAADWIGEARAFPLVDMDREPVGWIVEHRSGAARLSVTGEWI
ncbi:MAG: hypothetical protein OXB97_10710 [Rhodospirillales bacterium]|nr:hypothetical protein [Rhodospirillales bacterium]